MKRQESCVGDNFPQASAIVSKTRSCRKAGFLYGFFGFVPPEPAPKKPYKKPAFRHERVFETMALACGKLSPTQLSCRFNRKNS